MSEQKYRLGWVPDVPDCRDLYKAEMPSLSLPRYVYLVPYCPPVYNQGNLGSCTAQAIAAAIEFDRKKDKLFPIEPSKLFVYYNERSLLGTIDYDSGARIRDGMKSISRYGVCTETDWPYVLNMFNVKPPNFCYKNALGNVVRSYQRVNQTLNSIKQSLVNKCPVIFGMAIYESFMSDKVEKTGIAEMPTSSDSSLGGHAVLIVGYNNSYNRFMIRNSWGPEWGINGYFTLPYDYVLNNDLCCDFWAIN